MNTIIYLLQVSACTAIFYLYYHLLLSKLTFFSINRWYLMATVLLSFVIPVLTIPVHYQQQNIVIIKQAVNINTLQNVPVNVDKQMVNTVAKPADWPQLVKIFYVLILSGLLIHLLITLIIFFNRLKGKQITKIDRVNILRGETKLNNGSFFNYIFLNDQQLSADEVQQIIAHEILHVKFYHSADRLLIKLVQIILWFNPFIYLYSSAIEENHEFEVDCEMAISTDKKQYANLLLQLSVAGQGMLYHSFSKIPLKKRIVMLFNQPSAKMKKAVYVLILPVLMISCLAFARLKTDQSENKKISAIDGTEKLGKNPLIVIDGKVYPKNILYKISPSCIKGSTVISPNSTVKRLGKPVKDGYIEIKTKEGKITYITPFEKENLIKESMIPKSQFYTWLRLHDLEGGGYIDKIIIHEKSAGISANLGLNDKAGFLINNKLYSEQQVKTLPLSGTESLSGENGVGPAGLDRFKGVDTKGFDLIFYWDVAKETDTTKAIQNQKSTSQQIKKVQNQFAKRYFKVTDLTYQAPENILSALKQDQYNSYLSVGKSINVNTLKSEQERVYRYLAAMFPHIDKHDIVFNVDTTLQKGFCTIKTVVKPFVTAKS